MRKAQLSNISEFIDDAEKQLDHLLEYFGWDKADLLNTKTPQQIDKKATASGADVFPKSFYDEQHPFTVKVDKYVQTKVLQEAQNSSEISSNSPMEREIPTNHEDLLVNFSAEERLALNQYVLQNTPAIEPIGEIQISFKKQNKDAKMTSLADIAAYRRNIFRRNQKYRVAKNPLTYQEEVRNLIQMQTDAMTEYLVESRVKQEPREGVIDKRSRNKETMAENLISQVKQEPREDLIDKRKRGRDEKDDDKSRRRRSRFD